MHHASSFIRISSSLDIRKQITRIRSTVGFSIAAMTLLCSASMAGAQSSDTQPFLPNPLLNVSTVPANGDVNPYGVAFVPEGFNLGLLHSGGVLVSNFNSKKNLQGTGTTIVQISTGGHASLFFHGKSGLGLSTALNVLKSGTVLVGNFPSPDGTCPNSTPGSILVLNAWGQHVGTVANKYVNGPWDSTVIDKGNRVTLFVANGLDGTISRLIFMNGHLKSARHIGSGFGHQCDSVTFVDAPTGLVYNPKNGDLYVASSLDNKVFALHDAATTDKDEGTGEVLYEDNAHLHGPLGMAWAPNGHLLVANNDAINSNPKEPSEIVEFTLHGKFVKQLSVDPSQGGSFGLSVQTRNGVSRFAAVDDVTNTLLIWTLPEN